MALTDCPVCGGTLELFRVPLPLWGRYWCDECEEFRGYAPLPPEEYGNFVMPFGRHEGETLAEIASVPGGIGYLGWASLNLTGVRIREVILGYLEQLWSEDEDDEHAEASWCGPTQARADPHPARLAAAAPDHQPRG